MRNLNLDTRQADGAAKPNINGHTARREHEEMMAIITRQASQNVQRKIPHEGK